MTPADAHDCGWKEEAEKLKAENAALKKLLFGKKSEKGPHGEQSERAVTQCHGESGDAAAGRRAEEAR